MRGPLILLLSPFFSQVWITLTALVVNFPEKIWLIFSIAIVNGDQPSTSLLRCAMLGSISILRRLALIATIS